MFDYIITPFFVTISLILFLRPLAFHIKLVDLPGGRKDHQNTTPLIGGIAVFFGLFVCLAVTEQPFFNFLPLFVASSLLVFIGLIDDIQNTDPKMRLITQCIAIGLIYSWGDVRLYNLGNLVFFGDLSLYWLALPMTLFGAVTLINSINMIDGIDGLASGVCLFSFLAMAGLCATKAQWHEFYFLMSLCSCLVAFLILNWRTPLKKSAVIFLGDAGSLFLGLMLAWFAISLTQGDSPVARPVTMLWLIALPLMDLLTVFIRRSLRRLSPLKATREHVHHLLLNQGFSRHDVVLFLWTFTWVCILIGLSGEWFHVNEGIMFLSFLTLFFVYFKFSNALYAKQLLRYNHL